MTEYHSAVTEILIRPVPDLFYQVRPEFKKTVQELDQECSSQNGHGLFWRLYIDRLHNLELTYFEEARTLPKPEREEQLKFLTANLVTQLGEVAETVVATRNDPRLEFLADEDKWRDPDTANVFVVMERIQSSEELPTLYNLLDEIKTWPLKANSTPINS